MEVVNTDRRGFAKFRPDNLPSEQMVSPYIKEKTHNIVGRVFHNVLGKQE